VSVVREFTDQLLEKYRTHRAKIQTNDFEALRLNFHDYVLVKGERAGLDRSQIQRVITVMEHEFLARGIERLFFMDEHKLPLRGKFRGVQQSIIVTQNVTNQKKEMKKKT